MIKNLENHKVLIFLHQFLIYYNKNIDYDKRRSNNRSWYRIFYTE